MKSESLYWPGFLEPEQAWMYAICAIWISVLRSGSSSRLSYSCHDCNSERGRARISSRDLPRLTANRWRKVRPSLRVKGRD